MQYTMQYETCNMQSMQYADNAMHRKKIMKNFLSKYKQISSNSNSDNFSFSVNIREQNIMISQKNRMTSIFMKNITNNQIEPLAQQKTGFHWANKFLRIDDGNIQEAARIFLSLNHTADYTGQMFYALVWYLPNRRIII